MAQWRLSIADETDRKVREFLSRTESETGDLSTFVERAVRCEVLRRTVIQIQEQNVDLSAEESMALANDALDWARARPS